MVSLQDRRRLELLQIVAGTLFLGAYAVGAWLGTVAPIPAGIGLVTIVVGLAGLGRGGADRSKDGDWTGPESMCFIAPIVLLNLPPAEPGAPPWRLTFFGLGAVACAFSILLVGIAHRSVFGGE